MSFLDIAAFGAIEGQQVSARRKARKRLHKQQQEFQFLEAQALEEYNLNQLQSTIDQKRMAEKMKRGVRASQVSGGFLSSGSMGGMKSTLG